MGGIELGPIKLTDKAEEWLSIFLEDALQQGLSGAVSHIPEKVYFELSSANIIERGPGKMPQRKKSLRKTLLCKVPP